MINKFKNANKEPKQYKVTKVKSGTAKNGKPYTMFTIADSTKTENGWNNEYYQIFSWQPDLKLVDGDKIEILDIEALEVKESEYNGKPQIKKTIFADVKVIPANPQPPTTDVVDGLPDLAPIDDDTLPF